MIINPDTNVKILKNVPLDTRYEHSIIFGSKTAQESYFSSLSKHSLTGLTYQRLAPAKMRVGIKAEDLYDCNYLMYQNSSFGNKWFYAFINNVEYVNNECSEITFEIDVLQTWLFDCNPGTCYIDRCHTTTDEIGEHIEPEPVSPGEYVLSNYTSMSEMADMSVVIAETFLTDDESVNGKVYGGIYSGSTLWGADATDYGLINAILERNVQTPENITSIYMVPSFAIGYADGEEIPRASGTLVKRPTRPTVLDGYTPRNNKLYTYPYCYLHVDNSMGQSLALRYEWFTGSPVLNVISKTTPSPACTLYPSQYKGAAGLNTTESLTIAGYPLCSWNYNAYQTWLAQESVPLAITAIGSLASSAVTSAPAILSGNPLGLIGSAINTATSVTSQAYKASIAADMCRGNLSNGTVNVGNRLSSFNYGCASGSAEFLRMCDDYFDRFGYHVGRIMAVNRSARPNWTYVKTIGIDMRGSVPADDMRKIASIYDAGITWWSSGAAVGNFSLNNKPQAG